MADNQKFSLDDILAEYDKKSTTKKETAASAANGQKTAAPSSVKSTAGSSAENKKTPAQTQAKSKEAVHKPSKLDISSEDRAAILEMRKAKAKQTELEAAKAKKAGTAAKPHTAASTESEKTAGRRTKPASAVTKKENKKTDVKKTENEKAQKSVKESGKAAVNKKSAAAKKKKKGFLFNKSSEQFKDRFEQRKFLFKQLVKRDFRGRYKRTVLGVLWSILSPMFTFVAQALIFSVLFNRGEHFIAYLVVGNVVYHYFTDSTTSGMFALVENGGIISKIRVPKSMFLLSKFVSCLINFGLTMIIMFAIVAVDGIPFSPLFFMLIVPILLMTVFNMGVGYMLSAWFVFFKDVQYLYSIFTMVLMYFCAIFYRVDMFDAQLQSYFYINPVYCYITYFRTIIIDQVIPDLNLNLLCILYALLAMTIGLFVYKKNTNKYVFYF